MVGTSLVAIVQNGLSQLHGVTSRAHFTVAMIRGLGGNLTLPSREAFAKQVIIYTHVCMFTFPSSVNTCMCKCMLVYVCVLARVYMALQPMFTRERQTESIHTVHSQSSMLTCSD